LHRRRRGGKTDFVILFFLSALLSVSLYRILLSLQTFFIIVPFCLFSWLFNDAVSVEIMLRLMINEYEMWLNENRQGRLKYLEKAGLSVSL
jgi:hypothetical protein